MKNWEQQHRVNWVDGMKINKGHFIQSEDALLQNQFFLANAVLSKNQYGLLPNGGEGDGQLRIWISEDNQKTTTVKVLKCRAITPAGVPVFISTPDTNMEEITAENTLVSAAISNEEGNWPKYLVLQVQPFERVAVGDSSMDETPPRKPFVTPRYSLSLIDQNELEKSNVGQFHLPIAKFVVNIDGFVKMEEDYIPPSIAVSSHRRLLKEFNDILEV